MSDTRVTNFWSQAFFCNFCFYSSYLPLSHVAATMMDNFVILVCRGTTYFADKSALKVQFYSSWNSVVPKLDFLK